MSRGGTVKSDFLDRISEALFGSGTNQEDTYRKAEFVLSGLGETYDPWWDTSEAQGSTGGGTVTTRAYSRIRARLAGEQRCFAVPGSVAAGREESHMFNGRPHRIPLAEAGPGSNLLFFDETSDGYVATGVGTVILTDPGWTDPWRIQWAFRPFEVPMLFHSPFRLPFGVFEISVASFESFGLATAELESINAGRADAAIAERLASTYDVDDVQLNLVVIPPRSVVGGPIATLTEATYSEEDTGALRPTNDAPVFRRPHNRALSREIEQRGVNLAHRALTESGWQLESDRQKDGVGYDFVYLKDGRRIHVEVKGIQGARIEFNLTPKEWWRALTDQDWLLLTVTNALSPAQSTISVFTGHQVRSAPRSVVSYRLSI